MIKYDVKLNNGVEAFGTTEKTVTAAEHVENVDTTDPTSGNQGNNPNPGSGDDGMN